MEVRRITEWKKPLPDPDAIEAPFYAAAARGELLYQRCSACGHAQFYPRGLCTDCGATPDWATASGRGRVYTFTIIRQTHSEGFKDEIPYAVAMIELPEGVKMMGNLTDCPLDEIQVGMAVEAYAVEVAEGMALPYWRPMTAGSDG
jgi:uncharacterized OB-fold protein